MLQVSNQGGGGWEATLQEVAYLFDEARGVRNMEADRGPSGSLHIGSVPACGEDPVLVLLLVGNLKTKKNIPVV